MAQAQSKTVPFPGSQKQSGMPENIPGDSKGTTVVNHLFSPMVDKFLVPAAWFAGGIIFAKIFLRPKERTF